MRLERAPGAPDPSDLASVRRWVRAARSGWIALLDHDDRWLPGKLAAQTPYLDGFGVVATNAVRSNGERYFPSLDRDLAPTRRDLLTANPIIISSSIVRRSLLLEVGAFDSEPWMRAVADYSLWLRLSDAAARFVVLARPSIAYDDAGRSHLSASSLQMQSSLVRLIWRHLRRAPGDRDLLRAMARETYSSIPLALVVLRAELRRRQEPAAR